MKATILLFCTLFTLYSHAQTTAEIGVTKDLHFQINQYRESIGLKRLNALKELNWIARQHSQDMADGKIGFSHKGFDGRVQQVKRAYGLSSYRVAENLYMTTAREEIGAEALQGWIDSPGHKENLHGKFLYTGIGVVRGADGGWYITQLYVMMKKPERKG